MKSLPREKTTLQERMERIEKQNRCLKSCMVVLVLSVLALAVMGAKAGPGDGHFRQIIAEGITIVDGAGQELILIGFRKDAGTGIRILNKAGKRVLGIGIAADEEGSGWWGRSGSRCWGVARRRHGCLDRCGCGRYWRSPGHCCIEER